MVEWPNASFKDTEEKAEKGHGYVEEQMVSSSCMRSLRDVGLGKSGRSLRERAQAVVDRVC